MKEDIVSANESLNKWCNTQGINYYEGTEALGLLFKYAVPLAIKKLESRFNALENQARGLEILSWKWCDKIREGFSLEGALFWVIWGVKE